jgi:hypothetical protein
MKVSWPRAHWTVGTVTLVLFPLAGLYMREVAGVPGLNDVPRLVFRSRFLFILLIAVANLALSSAKPQNWAQRIAAAIILVAPAPLIAAFFLDPNRGLGGSPWTSWTMRGLFAAGVLLALVNRKKS